MDISFTKNFFFRGIFDPLQKCRRSQQWATTRGICATNAALQEDGLDIHGQVIKQGHFLCLSIARVSKLFVLSFLVAKFSQMLEEEMITILTFLLIFSMSKVLYKLPTANYHYCQRQECKTAGMIFDNFQKAFNTINHTLVLIYMRKYS